ncbi:MAG: hypothetical protein MJZ90_12150 [Bacteroidales bacterium]|nr:hypothetical protein [Bacteroidales bacterium]
MNIYEQKINDIVDVLSDFAKTLNCNIGLLSGTTGMSLFFNVLARLSNDNSLWNLSEQYINQTIDKLQKDDNPVSTYCSGLAGISFILSSDIIDLDDFEISEEIYKYLYVSLIAYLRQNNIDFLHGATGVMLGLLSSKNEMSNLAINNYIDYLWNTKEVINGSYRWKMMNKDKKG